jgi:hypothetical protein
MAQHVMNMEGHGHDPFDPNDPSRKRSKVSRACDECRRKKVRAIFPHVCPYALLTTSRFDAMRRARTAQKLALVARGQERAANLVASP